jgi:hypothetical protein
VPIARIIAKLAAPLLSAGFLAGCVADSNTFRPYNVALARAELHLLPEDAADLVNPVDGTYKGVVTRVVANAPTCPVTDYGTVEIGDKTVTFAYTAATIFVIPVAPDGRVFGRVGQTTLNGSVREGRLIFTVSSPACVTEYSLRYVI